MKDETKEVVGYANENYMTEAYQTGQTLETTGWIAIIFSLVLLTAGVVSVIVGKRMQKKN